MTFMLLMLYAGAGLLLTLGRFWIIAALVRYASRGRKPLSIAHVLPTPLVMFGCVITWPIDLFRTLWLLPRVRWFALIRGLRSGPAEPSPSVGSKR